MNKYAPLTILWRRRNRVLEPLLDFGDGLVMLVLGNGEPFRLHVGGEGLKKFFVYSTANCDVLIFFGAEFLNSLLENWVNFGAMFWSPNVVRCSSARQFQLNTEEFGCDVSYGILCRLVKVRLSGLVL